MRVPDSDGRWHDPRICDCELNIHWHPHIETEYVEQFHAGDFVDDFIAELRTRWQVPPADLSWAAQLPFPPRISTSAMIVGRLRNAVYRLTRG